MPPEPPQNTSVPPTVAGYTPSPHTSGRFDTSGRFNYSGRLDTSGRFNYSAPLDKPGHLDTSGRFDTPGRFTQPPQLPQDPFLAAPAPTHSYPHASHPGPPLPPAPPHAELCAHPAPPAAAAYPSPASHPGMYPTQEFAHSGYLRPGPPGAAPEVAPVRPQEYEPPPPGYPVGGEKPVKSAPPKRTGCWQWCVGCLTALDVDG